MFTFTIRDLLITIVMMLAGAFVGYCVAPFAVSSFSGYDHGHETEEYALYTIPGGAVAGLLLHLWLSRVKAQSVSRKS